MAPRPRPREEIEAEWKAVLEHLSERLHGKRIAVCLPYLPGKGRANIQAVFDKLGPNESGKLTEDKVKFLWHDRIPACNWDTRLRDVMRDCLRKRKVPKEIDLKTFLSVFRTFQDACEAEQDFEAMWLSQELGLPLPEADDFLDMFQTCLCRGVLAAADLENISIRHLYGTGPPGQTLPDTHLSHQQEDHVRAVLKQLLQKQATSSVHLFAAMVKELRALDLAELLARHRKTEAKTEDKQNLSGTFPRSQTTKLRG